MIIVYNLSTMQAFNQNPYSTAWQLKYLLYLSYSTYFIKVPKLRSIYLAVNLSCQKNLLIIYHSLLKSIYRLLAANIEMNNHIWENHHSS